MCVSFYQLFLSLCNIPTLTFVKFFHVWIGGKNVRYPYVVKELPTENDSSVRRWTLNESRVSPILALKSYDVHAVALPPSSADEHADFDYNIVSMQDFILSVIIIKPLNFRKKHEIKYIDVY